MKAIIPQSQIEIDIADLEFDLPDELRSVNSLELFEEQVVIAFDDIEEAYQAVNDAYTRAAYHVHMIMEYDLWRLRTVKEVDPETGEVTERQLHGSQEEYLEDLAGKTLRGFAVSTCKQFHTSIRVARHLGYSRHEIEDRGIYIFNEINKRVEKDHNTGTPLALKDGRPPGGREINDYLREVVEETVASGSPDVILKPRDFKLEIERRLSPYTAKIDFFRLPGKDMTKIQWSYELYDEAGMLQGKYGTVSFQWEGDVPEGVKVKFLQKLGVKLE